MEAKVVLLDKDHSDEDLSSCHALDVRNVDSRGFSEILERSRATDLRIYHLKIGSLDGIDRLHSVATLRLEWATKVTTLGPVYNMSVSAARTPSGRLVLTGAVWSRGNEGSISATAPAVQA